MNILVNLVSIVLYIADKVFSSIPQVLVASTLSTLFLICNLCVIAVNIWAPLTTMPTLDFTSVALVVKTVVIDLIGDKERFILMRRLMISLR